MCVLSESSFPGCFLFRSRGVFHFLPALPQSWSGFLHVFQLYEIYRVWLCMLACVSAHEYAWDMRNMQVFDAGARGKWDTGLLRCVQMWPSLRAHKHRPTPLRSETDKKSREVTFPPSDVTACENPVTNQPLSLSLSLSLALSLSRLLWIFIFFVPPPSFINPTWPDFVLRHRYLPRGYGVSAAGSDTKKAKKPPTNWLLFMWLALLHHWWNSNFLATRRNVSASRLGAVVLTLADVIGCLLCRRYNS